MTYESTDGGQELRLHRLLLRESTAYEDRIVGDLVGDLMCEAREGRRRPDERRRVEGSGHAVRWQKVRLFRTANVRWLEVAEVTYARPSVLHPQRYSVSYDRPRQVNSSHVVHKVTEQIEVR